MADFVPGRIESQATHYPPMAFPVGWPAARLPEVGEVVTCPGTYRGSVRLRIERVGWEMGDWNGSPGQPTVVYVVHGVEVLCPTACDRSTTSGHEPDCRWGVTRAEG